MKASTLGRILAVTITLALGVTLAGCGSKPDGKYSGAGGMATLELKSGKATFTSPGNTETCDYTVDGDKITLQTKKAVGRDMTFTIMKDGSLQGEGGTFTKSGG